MKTGVELIKQERKRQIKKEGFDADNDDQYQTEELSQAASCYALPGDDRIYNGDVPENWPWNKEWWKPAKCEFGHDENYKEERIKELAKAGALVAAEIDRLQRS